MNKYLILSLVFVLSACSSKPAVQAELPPAKAPPAVTAIAPDLTATEIEKGAFVIKHEYPTAPANSMVVEMSPTELLVIDTPWTPAATTELLKWTKTKFGERKITVVNTHSHQDRVGGNEVYLANGFPVYSSDLTIQILKKEAKPYAANHSFPLKKGKILQFGEKKAEIFYPGHGHTKDNVVVYLPEYKILFGGCFIVGMPKLGYIKEADLKAWPKALATLSRFETKWVIPGHYDSYSPELIQHTMDLVK